MRLFKLLFLLITIVSLTSCASGYKIIEPETLNFLSQHEDQNVKLEYKYNLLGKKYKKKEEKKEIKLVAIKVTNNSNRDVVFGRDALVTFENGYEVSIYDEIQSFKMLKQSPATHLFYLLLSPLQLYTNNGTTGGSGFPIGLILGPGITGTNMIIAGSANKKFKKDLEKYNLQGISIKIGETKYGILAIQSKGYEGLKIKVK